MFDFSGAGLGRRALFAGVGAGALMLATGRPAKAEIKGLVVIGSDGWLYPIWDEPRRFEEPRFQTTTKLLVDACTMIKKAGIEVVISLTPAKARIYRENLPKEFQFIPATEVRYQRTLEVFAKAGIMCPDLATLFLNARKANPQINYFFKSDTHWTPAGAELAAVEISKEVNQKLKLPASKQPGVKLGEIEKMVQSKNDLAEQLGPEDKPKYPKELYEIRKKVVAPGGLIDAEPADVELIGNSYTQPKYMFADHLSVGLNRPVGLTWHVHQFGSYAILLEYLNSKDFKANRPKLIIWDFEETDMEGPPDRKDFWGDHAMPNQEFLDKLAKALA